MRILACVMAFTRSPVRVRTLPQKHAAERNGEERRGEEVGESRDRLQWVTVHGGDGCLRLLSLCSPTAAPFTARVQ